MAIRKKEDALFLPFMQIPTGHHHAADAVMVELQEAIQSINCEKVDILSYSYGKIEALVSAAYLKWIKMMPKAYDVLYQQLAVKNQTKRSRQLLYEILFTFFFKRLMKENNPSIVFCTHALPSNIASILKQKKQLQAKTVNVYTDFFVNRVWGIAGIDYHLVPSIRVKEFLLQIGVDESSIYVTGIPVHPIYRAESSPPIEKRKLHILVTGGSLGVGSLEKVIPENPTICYNVLCGHNDKLFHRLSEQNNPHIIPIPYVNQKEKMNAIYDGVDAVLTKPGGVTISECLMKRKPIFTCNALPGQEKVNELELREMGVVQSLDPLNGNIEEQIQAFFTEGNKELFERQLLAYHEHLDKRSLQEILWEICR